MNKISKKMWLLLASVGVVAFIGGYGSTANAWHANWHGYFFGTSDTTGLEVLPPWGGRAGCQGDGWAMPGWVDTPSEFINFTTCKLGGSTQERRGAAFIISTMTGMRNVNPGATEINEFAARVNFAASRGWINFGAVNGCILPNTYYQDSGSGDVAKYSLCGSGAGNGINFYNGSDWYVIKRFCANPVGNMPALADDVNFTISGTSSVDDPTVSPGQQVTFSHNVHNNGPTRTNPFAITWNTEVGPSASGPWSYGGVIGSSGPFGGVYGEDVGIQTITVPANAAPNSQICYRLYWEPYSHNGSYDWSVAACATVQSDYSLTPTINAVITGASGVVAGTVAEAGDSVTFTYAVNNSGTTQSPNVTCTYRQASHTGYSTAAPTTVFTPPGASCAPSRIFPPGNTTIATETVNNLPANRSVCRSISVAPASSSSGTPASNQSCIHVASKPYVRAYGGDVAAGSGFASASGSCSVNGNAAIIGWNRRAAGSWSGAGVQYAAFAMDQIFDTATSLGNGVGSAPAPTGLSFANVGTTPLPNAANGIFGGMWGPVPCIEDYYGDGPDSPLSLPGSNLDLLTTGVYESTGNTYFDSPGGFSGIDPNQRTTVYINGNVHINTNIFYAGPWNVGSTPSFRIIVRGNIYINHGVTRLDGLFVAQPSNANNGVIYTCAGNPSLWAPPTDNALAGICSNKLTINGAFAAKQIRLLRTAGTMRQSLPGETGAAGAAAEVFNYNPALWMGRPADADNPNTYDAITSLPPIL